jgi:hypothetical protein
MQKKKTEKKKETKKQNSAKAGIETATTTSI